MQLLFTQLFGHVRGFDAFYGLRLTALKEIYVIRFLNSRGHLSCLVVFLGCVCFGAPVLSFGPPVVSGAKSMSYLWLAFFQLIFGCVYFQRGLFLVDFFGLLLECDLCVLQKARLTPSLHFFQLIFRGKIVLSGFVWLGKS